jgi:NAD(P)-dependent dehydrogenase (short-subunit alcohol dehydrogenase family)
MKETIVITGCSTGFGRAAALRFADRGDGPDLGDHAAGLSR